MKRDEGKIDDSVCRGSSGETQRVFDDLDPRFVHENLERWFQRGWEHCERILACGGDCGSSESTEQLEKYSREDEENGNSEQPKLSNSYKTSENSSNEYLRVRVRVRVRVFLWHNNPTTQHNSSQKIYPNNFNLLP